MVEVADAATKHFEVNAVVVVVIAVNVVVVVVGCSGAAAAATTTVEAGGDPGIAFVVAFVVVPRTAISSDLLKKIK